MRDNISLGPFDGNREGDDVGTVTNATDSITAALVGSTRLPSDKKMGFVADCLGSPGPSEPSSTAPAVSSITSRPSWFKNGGNWLTNKVGVVPLLLLPCSFRSRTTPFAADVPSPNRGWAGGQPWHCTVASKLVNSRDRPFGPWLGKISCLATTALVKNRSKMSSQPPVTSLYADKKIPSSDATSAGLSTRGIPSKTMSTRPDWSCGGFKPQTGTMGRPTDGDTEIGGPPVVTPGGCACCLACCWDTVTPVAIDPVATTVATATTATACTPETPATVAAAATAA